MEKQWFQRIIRQKTEKCRVTRLGENGKKYDYGILPIESRLNALYLEAVTAGIADMMKNEIKKSNVIVGIEAKSFVFTPLVAKKCNKSWAAFRKRDYNVPDQIVAEHETPYGKREKMHCVGLRKGDKPLIVDDMISGGGTMVSIINEVKKHYEVVGVGTLYNRGNGREIVKKETGFSPKSLATIDVVNGKVKVLSFYPDNNLVD